MQLDVFSRHTSMNSIWYIKSGFRNIVQFIITAAYYKEGNHKHGPGLCLTLRRIQLRVIITVYFLFSNKTDLSMHVTVYKHVGWRKSSFIQRAAAGSWMNHLYNLVILHAMAFQALFKNHTVQLKRKKVCASEHHILKYPLI